MSQAEEPGKPDWVDAQHEAAWRYASMLAGGNASICMHALFMGKGKDNPEDFQKEIEASIYRALRQAFKERMGVALPEQRDMSMWSESEAEQGTPP